MSTTTRQNLLIDLPNGQELSLKEYIKLLKGRVKARPESLSELDSGVSENDASTTCDNEKSNQSSETTTSSSTVTSQETIRPVSPSRDLNDDNLKNEENFGLNFKENGEDKRCQNCLKITVKKKQIKDGPLDSKNCKIKTRRPIYKPFRTEEEERTYQDRMKRLRAKIEEREYEGMTKNITSKNATSPHLHTVMTEVGSASKIAYSYITISVSVLVSIMSFFFLPLYLLPEATFPLGLRVGIGFVLATLVLVLEIYFYAKAYMGEHLSKKSDDEPLYDKSIYEGNYNRDKVYQKVSEWQKKTN